MRTVLDLTGLAAGLVTAAGWLGVLLGRRLTRDALVALAVLGAVAGVLTAAAGEWPGSVICVLTAAVCAWAVWYERRPGGAS